MSQSIKKRRTPLKISIAVLFALILRELRSRFGAHRLGAFWFVFEPIAHILVLLVLYTAVRLHANYGVDLEIFLLSGIVPFLLFKNIALKGMEAVSANKALFSYRQIKAFDTILARAILESILMACVYLAISFCLGFWGGHSVLISHPLEWIGANLVGVALAFGLGLLFCVAGEKFPEIKTFIKIIFLPLYFLSAVVFPVWLIPPGPMEWMKWNPLIHIIDAVRYGAIASYPRTEGIGLGYPTAFAVLTLFAGLAVYRSQRYKLTAT